MKLHYKPNVYSGAEDSDMLANQVKNFCKDKLVLDMGCGSGIQAITAALNSAKKVVAVDINFDAVKLTKENAELNNLNIESYQSDLFSNVTGKFDLIVFNAPYLPLDKEIAQAEKYGVDSDDLKWSGGKTLIMKFLKQATAFLNSGGDILFVYSSLTKLPKVKDLKILDTQHFGFEDLYVAQLRKV